MPLWGKTDSAASLPKSIDGVATVDNVLFEDMSAIYKDEEPGVKDPSGRNGWYFENLVTGNKINWYVIDTADAGIELGSLAFYAVVTMDILTDRPFLIAYTSPEESGNAGSWYRSRLSQVIPSGAATAGTKYLVHYGVIPADIHPDLPRIEVADSLSTIGPRGASETIFHLGLGSNSSASAGNVKFLCEAIGVISPQLTKEWGLRIRADYNNPELPTSPKGTLGSTYLIDIEEAAVARTKGIKGPGWWVYKPYQMQSGRTRHKAECLVAMKVTKAQAGDRDNDDFITEE